MNKKVTTIYMCLTDKIGNNRNRICTERNPEHRDSRVVGDRRS
jgi:hypothetical protein